MKRVLAERQKGKYHMCRETHNVHRQGYSRRYQSHVAPGNNQPAAAFQPAGHQATTGVVNGFFKDMFHDLSYAFKPDKPTQVGPQAYNYLFFRFTQLMISGLFAAALVGCVGMSVFSAIVIGAIVYGGLKYRAMFKDPTLFGHLTFDQPKTPVLQFVSDVMQAVFVSAPDWLIQQRDVLIAKWRQNS